MTEVFKNKKLNDELSEKGYVVTDLLSAEDIAVLENFYYNETPAELQNAYTTFATNNIDYKKKTDEFIKKVIHSKSNHLFSGNYEPFWGNYMLKSPGKESNMPLHADWQYVDEPENISFNIWIPLVDTDMNNGALQVIPSSHKAVSFPRGVNLPRYYEAEETILKKKFGKILTLKKGQAIIYDHRLLHYSMPNLSTTKRIAVTLIYVPSETPINYYHFNRKENQAYKYFVNSYHCLIESDYFEAPANYLKKEKISLPEKLNYSIKDRLEEEKGVLNRFFNNLIFK